MTQMLNVNEPFDKTEWGYSQQGQVHIAVKETKEVTRHKTRVWFSWLFPWLPKLRLKSKLTLTSCLT